MPDPIQIDSDLALSEIEQFANALEQDFFKNDGCIVYSIIAGTGSDEGFNKVVPVSSLAAPIVDNMVLRSFPGAVDVHDVAMALDDIEQQEPLVLRHWSRAWVANNPSWLAIFDKRPATPPPTTNIVEITGLMSHFGGPDDHTMKQFEDTAFVENEQQAKDYPGFFLPFNPARPTGWGRRLDTATHYIACRWNEYGLSKSYLRKGSTLITVRNPANGKELADVRAIDWGPDADSTGRNIDLSPAVEIALGLETDLPCVVRVPVPGSGTPDAKLKAEDKPAASAPLGKRRAVFLTGDYSRRAQLASQYKCTWTVDFHFNAADGPAFGAEVYYSPNDKAAEKMANAVLDAINSLGLKNTRSAPLQEATSMTRAGYIRHYSCHALLLEPLFISETIQNQWINNPVNQEHLAQVVARALKEKTSEKDLIGLSIGHLGKTSNPGDRGADAKDGDHVETDYNAPMAKRVSEILTA